MNYEAENWMSSMPYFSEDPLSWRYTGLHKDQHSQSSSPMSNPEKTRVNQEFSCALISALNLLTESKLHVKSGTNKTDVKQILWDSCTKPEPNTFEQDPFAIRIVCVFWQET